MPYLSKGYYKELERTAIEVLSRLSQLIDINTVFIARNDKEVVEITHSFNRDYLVIEEGLETKYTDSYWQFIVDNDRESLTIEDLNKNERTKNMAVTKKLGGGTLLGVPIFYENGENYGTLCGMDIYPRIFQKEEIELFQTMAKLLGYVIDLDVTKDRILTISTPIVPIEEGIVILPLVGEMDQSRSEVIIDQVLAKSYQDDIEYFIIDVSGLVINDQSVSENIIKLSLSLKLLGAMPILTGMRPDQAVAFHKSGSEILELTVKANLKQALHWIGFNLTKT